jgi:hypothetical protein
VAMVIHAFRARRQLMLDMGPIDSREPVIRVVSCYANIVEPK